MPTGAPSQGAAHGEEGTRGGGRCWPWCWPHSPMTLSLLPQGFVQAVPLLGEPSPVMGGECPIIPRKAPLTCQPAPSQAGREGTVWPEPLEELECDGNLFLAVQASCQGVQWCSPQPRPCPGAAATVFRAPPPLPRWPDEEVLGTARGQLGGWGWVRRLKLPRSLDRDPSWAALPKPFPSGCPLRPSCIHSSNTCCIPPLCQEGTEALETQHGPDLGR